MLATLASIARLHIVAIGALGTLTFGYAFTGERPWLLALLSALDWFVVNLLNRVVDLKEDAANQIRGTEWVARHKRLVLAVGFSVLGLSLALTPLVSLWVVPLRLSFHALGFAYNWPLVPFIGRIKERYFWKNTASATGFLLTCFCYPIAQALERGHALTASTTTIGCALLFFFLFELSYEVLYDLRDVEGDTLAGVRSYPAVHGARVGFVIAQGLMVGAFVIVAVAYASGALPWHLAIMGAAPLIQLGVARRMVARGITSRDCIAITWVGTALLAGWHVWERLGLPGASGMGA
jgi:4-hydroxybenzoate polyprenyltransferase